jgi:hypothetical protein
MGEEVRCPMCGKPNPPELEECQFCHARLKPLIVSPPPEEFVPVEPPESPTPEAAPEMEAELPDWLSELRSEEPETEGQGEVEFLAEEPGPEKAEEVSFESVGSTDDWLARLQVEGGSEDQLAFDEEQAGEIEDIPEWLVALGSQQEPDLAASISAEPAEVPVEIAPEVPPEVAPPVEGAPSTLPFEGSRDESLAALAGARLAAGRSTPESESAERDESAEIPPAALAGLVGGAVAARQSGQGKPAIPPKSRSEKVESLGPLAGLRDVLSAGPEIGRPTQPSTRPLKLRVTANQRIHADLLREMVASEGQPGPVPKRPAFSPQHVLRWGIALILFLALLWPVILDSQQASLPDQAEPVSEANRLVGQLQPDAPVLLAFDYEPGLAAEMDAVAQAVVDHLLLQGAVPILVSTSPTGPILAERFLIETQSAHTLASGIHYLNLGYIPGGTAGLLSFIENPKFTLPYTIDGEAAWETESHPALPPLQGVESIEDFPLLVVIVGDPDVARSWVEQLSPHLQQAQETALVIIASAQVEPLLGPYFGSDPRQVHGFVAGLRGGAAYARMVGRGDLSRAYWDAYGIGLFVAALLIIIAGLFISLSSMFTRSPRARTEAQG